MASDVSGGSRYLPSPTEVDYPLNASGASDHHHHGSSSLGSRATHYRSASFALNSQPASLAPSAGQSSAKKEALDPPRWHHGSHEFLYDDPRTPFYHREPRSDTDLESRGREPRSKATLSTSRISLNSATPATTSSPSRPSTSGSAWGGSTDQQQQAPTSAFLSGAQWFRSTTAATTATSPATNSSVSSSARNRSRSRAPGADDPDRHVRAVITTLSSSASSSRRDRGWMGGTSPSSASSATAAAEKRPLRLKAMAQRPATESGEYVVAGDESENMRELERSW